MVQCRSRRPDPTMYRLLLSLLLLLPVAASAADAPETYAGFSSGTLTIDETGAVVAADLENGDLGEEILAAYEERIRGWRFEPIVEDGRPVRAQATMQLRLLAFRVPGQDGMRLGFEDVAFVDPATPAPTAADFKRMPPPRYPSPSLRAGVGGVVQLTLRVGADGVPTDVAVTKLDLYGGDDDLGGSSARHAQELADAAAGAAERWTLPQSAGQLVTVPVTFRPGTGRGWLRVRSAAVDVPAWVAVATAAQVAVSLDGLGQRPTRRLQLLTPIDG